MRRGEARRGACGAGRGLRALRDRGLSRRRRVGRTVNYSNHWLRTNNLPARFGAISYHLTCKLDPPETFSLTVRQRRRA